MGWGEWEGYVWDRSNQGSAVPRRQGTVQTLGFPEEGIKGGRSESLRKAEGLARNSGPGRCQGPLQPSAGLRTMTGLGGLCSP